MKIFYKKAAAVIIALALLLSTSTISMGQYQTPSYIRVGLYYKDGSVNTALPIFNVSAAAGIQAGFFLNNTFTEIYREPSASTLYARKDTFFYKDGNGLKEYTPSATSSDSIASNAKWGPYHIKIGSDCPDQATAALQITAYRQAGVMAYIVYSDCWQVWAGSYTDQAAAQADLAVISPMIGDIGYTVIPPAANRIVLVNSQYQPLCIFGSNSAFFQLRPAPENNPLVISVKDKPYRGAVEVKRLTASDMSVINYVSVQEYLYGSVPAEIGGRSPAEAIKAQAIAAKMYAINNAGKHSKAGFDICPTTDCQVYKGYSIEVAQCNAAIDTVKDFVISYNGKLAGSIFYFASSGGRTEDVRNVWGSSIPYLVSVEDSYEKIYTWTKTLKVSDIRAKFPQLGNILGVSITQTAPSGRVTQLAVRGDSRSDPAVYLLEKCRTLFSLDSQLYTITSDADIYTSAFSNIPAAVALVPATASVGAANPSSSASAASDYTAQASAVLLASAATDTSSVDAGLLFSQTAVPASSDVSASDEAAGTSSVSVAGASQGITTDQTTATTTSAISGADPSAAVTTGAAIITPPAMKLSIPLPVTASPNKTQLGGKLVATANGISSLKASGNKITILGASGAIKTATLVPETYTFSGKGWGHAVGLSQEGAIGMGKAGISFDQILKHYFQGTNIEPG